jgi:hypothetical protein
MILALRRLRHGARLQLTSLASFEPVSVHRRRFRGVVHRLELVLDTWVQIFLGLLHDRDPGT